MNKTLTLIVIPSLLICTSCIRLLGALRPAPTSTGTTTTSAPAPAPAPTVETHQLSTCETKKAEYRARGAELREEAEQRISIERHFQRTIRKGCDGQTIKDSIETVQSPTALAVLRPERPIYRKVNYVKIFDSETCVERGTALPWDSSQWLGQWIPLTGKDDGTVQVNMDMADAWLTFKVTTGLNHLYYVYYANCGKMAGVEHCQTEDEVAVGVYQVIVDYRERTLPPRVIEATTESCATQQK